MPFSTTWSAIKNFANGGKIFPADLNDAFADLGVQLASVNVAGGFNEGTNVRRGKCIIPGAETRTNTAYGLMPTPDKVSSVVLPSNSKLVIAYEASWKESVSASARAAIFIGTNQLKYMDGSTTISPQPQETGSNYGGANTFLLIGTYYLGLRSSGTGTYPGGSTTGQIIGLGGSVETQVSPGTYDISVQFKSSSGVVTVQNRKLLVRVEDF